jgi:hypothetical protein
VASPKSHSNLDLNYLPESTGPQFFGSSLKGTALVELFEVFIVLDDLVLRVSSRVSVGKTLKLD